MTHRDEDHHECIADLRAMADTLRHAFASLDEQVEARAQQIAAQRGPLSSSELVREVMARMALIGESMRRDMVEQMGDDPQARDFLTRTPVSHWTSSAAKLVADICFHEAGRDELKKGGQRG